MRKLLMILPTLAGLATPAFANGWHHKDWRHDGCPYCGPQGWGAPWAPTGRGPQVHCPGPQWAFDGQTCVNLDYLPLNGGPPPPRRYAPPPPEPQIWAPRQCRNPVFVEALQQWKCPNV
jgi:hypothetical protein